MHEDRQLTCADCGASFVFTAGAGTGSIPWAERTMPVPLATGLDRTSSTPSTSSAAQVPTTSITASTPPTSWKWTWAGGRR